MIGVIPMFPPTCKYKFNLLKDYGKIEYVWMLELMNLFVIKGNVYIFVTKSNEKCCITTEGVFQGRS
jgi:hypothetical protein